MFRTVNPLPEDSRVRIADRLNATLADGVDLYTQVKVAHWNIRGPQFVTLHPFFDTLAGLIAGFNDQIAERAVILGARAGGTARQVAKASSLPEYPHDTSRDLEHARALLERLDRYLVGARAGREVAGKYNDAETVDLLTTIIAEVEKQAWFLTASTEA